MQEAVGQKLPQAIETNTQNITKVENSVTALAEDSKKSIAELREGYLKLAQAQDWQRGEDLKSSFLMYKHNLTYEELKAPYPYTALYAVVEKFFLDVFGAPLSEFPINKIKVKPVLHHCVKKNCSINML